jgi:molybdopterin-guanine dinucleotide biosynthesis protein B
MKISVRPTIPPTFAVIGNSGSGKTCLVELLIPRLRARGLRVGVLKHAHHGFEMDRPGKDSARASEAGADAVIVMGPNGLVEKRSAPPELAEALQRLDDMDLVIVEGYRTSGLPRVIAGPTAPEALSAGTVWATWRGAPAMTDVPHFDEARLDHLVELIILRAGLSPRRETPLFAILTGGEGRRLGGVDKALHLFQGRPMLDWMKELAGPYGGEIVVLSSRHEGELLGLRVLPDALADRGPLGGVLSGLRTAGPRGLIVMPCDMPRLKAETLKRLVHEASTGSRAAVAWDEHGAVPVLAWYGPAALPLLEREALRPRGRLARAVEALDPVRILLSPSEARDVDTLMDAENEEGSGVVDQA